MEATTALAGMLVAIGIAFSAAGVLALMNGKYRPKAAAPSDAGLNREEMIGSTTGASDGLGKPVRPGVPRPILIMLVGDVFIGAGAILYFVF